MRIFAKKNLGGKPKLQEPSANVKKVAISKPTDIYEQEADRIGEMVMGMRDPLRGSNCPCGGGCPNCRSAASPASPTLLQAKTLGTTEFDVTALPQTVDEVLGRSGNPLDASTRSFMEPRFGADFGKVRLHHDSLAASSARSVGARAYTVGNKIVFGEGQYVPGSDATQHLLAHELTHVVQQEDGEAISSPATPVMHRQADGSGEVARPAAGRADVGGSAVGSGLAGEYIRFACQAIADIQRRVEEGRTWLAVDNTALLHRADPANPAQVEREARLHQERIEALRELVRSVATMIEDLESGALVPTLPARRSSIIMLWNDRFPELRERTETWASGQVYLPEDEEFETTDSGYWGLDTYLYESPESLPDSVPRASLPIWWVLGCHASTDSEERPSESGRGRGTHAELGISRLSVIYLSGLNDDRWDWEPRADTDMIAVRPYYNWHEDEDGNVFITVDGRRRYLRQHGSVETR